MEIFDGEIILPTSAIDSKNKIKEYNIKAIIIGFGSDIQYYFGRPEVSGRHFMLLIEENSLTLIRKINFSGRLFDLEFENKKYIGCIILNEETVDCLQIGDYKFYNKIKVGYLRSKQNDKSRNV